MLPESVIREIDKLIDKIKNCYGVDIVMIIAKGPILTFASSANTKLTDAMVEETARLIYNESPFSDN